jgi:hypothetical protein
MLLTLLACAPAADPELRTLDNDRDRDGLLLGAELSLGTNPADPDTDGDGYLDGDEVNEGTDPLDAEDGIYIGGWPYQRDKEAFEGLGEVDDELLVGGQLPRVVLPDQFGEAVDLYDYAGQGRPVLMDISADWCGYTSYVHDRLSDPTADSEWAELAQLIEDGEIYWVTSLLALHNGPATVEDAADLDERFPAPRPVLVDPYMEVGLVQGVPTLAVLSEDLVVRHIVVGAVPAPITDAVMEELESTR